MGPPLGTAGGPEFEQGASAPLPPYGAAYAPDGLFVIMNQHNATFGPFTVQ